jgi:sporulation protein YlmC with PRC-barrel domain
MDIPINAEVVCVDGACGHSTHVILDPRTQTVTHLVVKNGHSDHAERLVPMDVVVEATPRQIRLRASREDVGHYQQFYETHYTTLKISRYAAGSYMAWPYVLPETETVANEVEQIPANELAVRRGAHVWATDGRVGKVDEFLVAPQSGHITHLVLREGHLWGQKDVTIPVSHIERYQEETVYLDLARKDVEALPTVPIRRD